LGPLYKEYIGNWVKQLTSEGEFFNPTEGFHENYKQKLFKENEKVIPLSC